MMKRRISMPAALLLAVLAACSGQQAPEAESQAGATNPESPGARPPGDAASPAPVGVAPAAPGSGPVDTAIDSLPPKRRLDLTVEGQHESREAQLFKSPQGYAIYV